MSAEINLWKQQLRVVPESVWVETEVETLILADNALEWVSPRIGDLKCLRTLDLGHNRLTGIPDAIGELVQLDRFLYLHDNRLATLPPGFSRLTRLRYLNISENELTHLPEAVTGLVALMELRASDNQIEELPSLGGVSHLRELHLRNNRLRSVPESIAELADLRQLDLRGNPLTRLPECLASLPRLEKLDLRWTPTLPDLPWFAALESRGCLVYR